MKGLDLACSYLAMACMSPASVRSALAFLLRMG